MEHPYGETSRTIREGQCLFRLNLTYLVKTVNVLFILSFLPFGCLSAYPPMYLSACLSVYPSVSPSVCRSVGLFIRQSVCLCTFECVMCVCVSVCLFVSLSTCLPVKVSACLPVCMSVFLSRREIQGGVRNTF